MRGDWEALIAILLAACVLCTGCIGVEEGEDEGTDASEVTVPLAVGDWMTYDVQECVYGVHANYTITTTIDGINAGYAVFNTTDADGRHSLANQPKGILQWAGTLGYSYKGVKYVEVPGTGTIQTLGHEKRWVEQSGVERIMNMVVVDSVPIMVSMDRSTPQGFRNYMLNDTSVAQITAMA